MADNYRQFSEVIPKLKKREEAWLKAQLQHVAVFGGKEYAIDPVPDYAYVDRLDLTDFVPAELAGIDPEWFGVRFLRDHEDYDPKYDSPGFRYSFDGPEVPRRRNDRWKRHLWIYADENGNPTHVVWLVRKFLKKFRPADSWSLTYSVTCSKPRVGEFSGGAVFVTADEIHWESAYDFVDARQTAFQAKETGA
ncbi:MAG: hypothetical protein GXY83_20845 [Rhodopirellula sp.]|nr:hypothetical protein [Rhodopirellula sp.]